MENQGIDPAVLGFMKEKIEILKALADVYGEGVLEVVDRLNRGHILPEWKAIAERQPAFSIEAYVGVLWEGFCRHDGLEFTVEASAEKIQIHCTHCPWVAAAQEAGSPEIGYWLTCRSDFHMIEGYNQAAGPQDRRIKFTRQKTLMQGDDCCDHCYTYEP